MGSEWIRRMRWKKRLSLFQKVKRPGSKSKRLIVAVVVLLVIAVAGGGAFAYLQHKKHELARAVESLNEAIATGNLADLSMRIDFSALSQDLVRVWAAAEPDKAPQTGLERRQLEDEVQIALHKAFTSRKSTEKESGEKGAEEKDGQALGQNAPSVDKLLVPIPPLPPVLPLDFAAQLAAAPFRLLGGDDDQALVASRIRHPDLSLDLPVQLLAVRKNGNWLFERLVNAEHLVADYLNAEQAFRMRREAIFFARNAEIREIMNRHCYITDCQVGVAKVGKDGSVLISLNLEGINTGEETLRSAGLRCRIRDQKGKVINNMPLNFNRRVKPESVFRQYWNFEFDAGTPTAAALLTGGRLSCDIEVQAVSLENGRLIYPRPYSELADRPVSEATEKPK